MQPVQRKTRRAPRHGRLLWLMAALALLAALGLLLARLNAVPDALDATVPTQEATLLRYTPEQVQSLAITRKGEPTWTIARQADGSYALLGEAGHPLSDATAAELTDLAAVIIADVLTDDPADYADHLSDYGLNDPEFTAVIAYADGYTATLRVGNAATHTNAWRYMLLDGDARLFALSKGAVEGLFVSEASLRDVEQPTLHRARIDRITLTESDGTCAQWTLTAPITARDAIDHWRITAPFAYPADATAMGNLLKSAANLRLGTYVCAATPAALSAHGFDAPRLIIEIHMAAGTIATTGMDGVTTTMDYPEGTVTFTLGGAETDMIDYVRHGDSIYRCSSFTTGMFQNIDLRATMSRYLTPVALGNLAELTIQTESGLDTYQLTRTEQVAPNNDLVFDEEGNIVYDVTVTHNGEPFDYAAFEAAYAPLVAATVSGVLPEGEAITAAPHTVFTFTDVDGSAHTVALTTFDVLHDAVIVDGHEAFYLIKGGFQLNIE